MYDIGMMATMTQSIDVSVAKQLVIAFGKKLAEQSEEEEDAEEVLICTHTYIHTYIQAEMLSYDISLQQKSYLYKYFTYIHSFIYQAELARQMKEAADTAADLDSSQVR